jgi:hypothetical protein
MRENIGAKLIAPCGINCGTCIAFFGYTMSGKKRKHSCSGCWSRERPCASLKGDARNWKIKKSNIALNVQIFHAKL